MLLLIDGSAEDKAVTNDDPMLAAQELLAAGQWTEASRQLAAVLSDRESAEAHAGMGTAMWWLGHVRESLNHRERAYAGYLADQRYAEAAMVALDVSVSYLSNLDNQAVAAGWIARARRAADLSGDDRLTGWMLLMEGYTSGDLQIQRDLLTKVLELSRARGDIDLELSALADLGLLLVRNGEVSGGLGLLDEAMAGTLGGEYERLETVVWTSCSMLAACTLVGDQKRAAQWCDAAERFSQTYGCPFLQAQCRSHYGRVLVGTGDWQLAETELNRALSMSDECGPAARIEALAGLAELRLRQGAAEEAERLLTEAGDGPDLALVTAEVMTARGHPARAVAVLQAELDSIAPHELGYPIHAAALVDAHLACGEIESAATAVRALQGNGRTSAPTGDRRDRTCLRTGRCGPGRPGSSGAEV